MYLNNQTKPFQMLACYLDLVKKKILCSIFEVV